MPARKGQGQWALGYREPLNPTSEPSGTTTASTSASGSSDIYQHTGFAGIDPADLRGRFRWYGLYTQRRPGIPGGKTATLEPEELEDELLHAADPHRRRRADQRAAARRRRRSPPSTAGTSPTSPTGRTSSCTGSASRTSRRSGASSRRSACPPPRPAATPRGSCSAARSKGVAADSVLDASAGAARDGRRSYIGDPAFSNLPRKFKTSISGCARALHQPRDQRRLVRRRHRPGRHARLRPLGRRRAVHQPEVRPSGWARSSAPDRGQRGVGRGRRRCSATTATGARATTPG